MGIAVLPPDVNESGYHFTVVSDAELRFGLGAVKNVGRSAIDAIIAARAQGPFASLRDLAARVDHRLCNKRVLEGLVASGACDRLGGHRAQLFAAIDDVLAEAGLAQAEHASGQATLFGGEAAAAHPPAPLPLAPEWSEAERLAREKELVGFFVSGHPLNRYSAEAAVLGTHTTADLGRWMEGAVAVAAVVTAVKRQIARRSGAEWARLVVEDFHGSAEVIVFPEAWAKLAKAIVQDGAYLLVGGYSPRDRNEEEARLVIEDAQPLAEMRAAGRIGLALRLQEGAAAPADAARAVASLCRAHPGPSPVFLEWTAGDDGGPVRFRSKSLQVALDDDLLTALRDLLGEDAVILVKAR
jgi:DNA polymerase-3 subunit alpha